MENGAGKRRPSRASKGDATAVPPEDKETSGSSGIEDFLARLDQDPSLKSSTKSRKLKRMTNRGGDIEDGPPGGADGEDGEIDKKKSLSSLPARLAKRLATAALGAAAAYLIWDAATSPPDRRILGSHRMHSFLIWLEQNPGAGAGAFICIYAMCTCLMIPATPLTFGAGYVYKAAYGWGAGVAIATTISVTGSLAGSVTCFLTGRYVMRDRVRRWGRRYPAFDAVDSAVSENGFKIMGLLYASPVLPLGPVSYLMGTTSMPLVYFALAKVACLPLMIIYVCMGASTDTFFDAAGVSTEDGGETGGGGSQAKKMGVDEDTHWKMVLGGLVMSFICMSIISHVVKKELEKIFEQQKQAKSDKDGESSSSAYRRSDSAGSPEEHVELAGRSDDSRLMRRPRGHADEDG
mmetsp:Transcript_20476/g.46282  ORF Transcript_20476/g.46282 Transcript_20476/m.46282 type:complete len:406 (-) Transcript_20476:72-1289(-)